MIRKRSQTDRRRSIATEKYVGHPLPETIQECESDDNVDEIGATSSSSSSSSYRRTVYYDGGRRIVSPELMISRPSSTPTTQNRRRVEVAAADRGRGGGGEGGGGGGPPVNSCSHQRVTGSATERSSIYSFGDDEFDRETSLSVQKLFDDVDLILFERIAIGRTQLRSECDDWMAIFPHLRVVGRTRVPVQEFGYKFFECTEESDLTPRNADDLSSDQELVARGACIKVHQFTGAELSTDSDNCEGSDLLHGGALEELFAQEGLVEEILAIDTRSFGDEGTDCIQREVLRNLFNETWADVINGLEELISRHLQHYFSRSSGYTVPVRLDPFHQRSLYPSSTHDMFLTRESTNVSFTTHQTAPDRISRQFSNMSSLNTKLGEVLKISSKALQVRDRTFSHDLSDCPLTRPSSSGLLPLSGRPYNPRVVNEYLPLSRSRPGAGKGKLNPISSHDQIKTVFTTDDEKQLDLSHEVIRGYRIATVVNNKLALVSSSFSSSSPPSTTASTLRPSTRPLPPISRDTRSSSGQNNIFRRKALLRVRSAVPNKAPHSNHDHREKAWGASSSGDYSRPQRNINLNIQTVATDHPPHVFAISKRSSTTLGFNSLTGHQNQPAETVGGVLGKGQRKLNVVLGNQIPEFDADGNDDDSLSDVVRISSNFSFGRRAGQRDQHFSSTAIR